MNESTKPGISRMVRFLSVGVLLVIFLILAGCAEEEIVPDTQATEVQETVPVVYDPVVSGNHNSTSLACMDTYVSDEANNQTVAQAGESVLTNRELSVFYNLEIAAYATSGSEIQPDYEIPMFAQVCPLTEEKLSWEHYFLSKALESWHTCQALVEESRLPRIITDTNYKAEPTTHEQFFSNTLPAYPLAYIDKECFLPNSKHQAFLDAIPEQVEALAKQYGFSNGSELAQTLAGNGAGAQDLESCVYLYNYAYAFFTELTYDIHVPDAAVNERYVLNPEEYADKEPTVTIRHCLMVPQGAAVDANGKVTATEEQWSACAQTIEELLEARRKDWVTNHNPENTFGVLAFQNSADGGTKAVGGLLVSIRKGQLNPQIEQWCFDPARAYGDVEVIRTDMGYEILFFMQSEQVGYAQARQDLSARRYGQKIAELKEQYPMKVDYSKICLTEAGAVIAPEDILYPDIAHERYPEMMVYLQQDYAPAPFGAYQVSRHGCGITTFAMVTTYMSDTKHTPAELAKEYGNFATPNGTDGNIFDRISPDFGFYCEKRCWDWESINEALNSDRIAVTLQFHGHFTKTGHYLAMIGLADNGNVIIRDSNIYNYVRLDGHKVDNFDPALVIANNSLYWIFQPKVRTIGACARCGTPDRCGMPDGLLLQDYTCQKCLTALSRRNIFLQLNAA